MLTTPQLIPLPLRHLRCGNRSQYRHVRGPARVCVSGRGMSYRAIPPVSSALSCFGATCFCCMGPLASVGEGGDSVGSALQPHRLRRHRPASTGRSFVRSHSHDCEIRRVLSTAAGGLDQGCA